MSKNLSNGFKFNTTDINVIHNHISEFRNTLTPLVYDKLTQFFADECAILYDTNTLSGKKIRGIFNDVYQLFVEKQEEVRVKGISDPSVDYQLSILIIPTEDCFYGLFYTEQPDYVSLWKDLPFVEEYSWYNNSDRPESVSEDVWSERGTKWSELLKDNNNVPSLSGFSYEVIPAVTSVLPKIQDVITKMPSNTDRTTLMARDLMFKRFCKGKKISSNNTMKVYQEFVEYMVTPEGDNKYQNYIVEMGTKLRLTITENEIK